MFSSVQFIVLPKVVQREENLQYLKKLLERKPKENHQAYKEWASSQFENKNVPFQWMAWLQQHDNNWMLITVKTRE